MNPTSPPSASPPDPSAPARSGFTKLGEVPFGPALTVERYRHDNGLTLLLLVDTSAPVVAYQTWFRVGSRHEQDGKTGISHLFEHLMFRETEHLAEGELDRRLEEAGADNNAATWLDWTQYTINLPADQLPLVVEIEAERMAHLVLREEQLEGEKEVVANERRYRVEDDVEGAVSEVLWATAFTEHGYRIPTIGWMQDIQAFEVADCERFYRTYYAPNNATVVVVGDVRREDLLGLMDRAYGPLAPSVLPVEDVRPEPPQQAPRERELDKATPTEKLVAGWHCPALGDVDHAPLSLLMEVLFGGRAARLVRRLVRERELATETRCFVGTFEHPGLTEVFLSAREGVTAEQLLEVLDEELARVRATPPSEAEVERARSRLELSLLASLETAEGKASTIGFYESVLRRPSAPFERLEALRAVTPSDLLRVARRWLDPRRRTLVKVRSNLGKAAAA